jgi:hypothetical protein
MSRCQYLEIPCKAQGVAGPYDQCGAFLGGSTLTGTLVASHSQMPALRAR